MEAPSSQASISCLLPRVFSSGASQGPRHISFFPPFVSVPLHPFWTELSSQGHSQFSNSTKDCKKNLECKWKEQNGRGIGEESNWSIHLVLSFLFFKWASHATFSLLSLIFYFPVSLSLCLSHFRISPSVSLGLCLFSGRVLGDGVHRCRKPLAGGCWAPEVLVHSKCPKSYSGPQGSPGSYWLRC